MVHDLLLLELHADALKVAHFLGAVEDDAVRSDRKIIRGKRHSAGEVERDTSSGRDAHIRGEYPRVVRGGESCAAQQGEKDERRDGSASHQRQFRITSAAGGHRSSPAD